MFGGFHCRWGNWFSVSGRGFGGVGLPQVDEEDGFLYHKDEVMRNADDSEKKSLDTYMLLYCGALSG